MAIIGGFLYATVELSKGKLEQTTNMDRSSLEMSVAREK
jgi:hypothetical protein